ncbi:leucine efflux protein LeuE [Amphibiibacter pelophylacis]|uniref:Leucine efflux protein LeuE n=1 Tax=Amphibiibacter pelophylacis TaxID=1799477 RepID=A0ACC6P1W2_9BURK
MESLGTSLGIIHLGTFVLGVIFIILLPGPNSLFVLSVASRRGVRRGWSAAAGVFWGDAVLITLTALGAATVLRTWPQVFFALKLLGAAYLFWVGLNQLRAALAAGVQARATPPATAGTAPEELPDDLRRAVMLDKPFQRALIISLLNPKAILFNLSFLLQFIQPGTATPGLAFLILGSIIECFSMIYLGTLIFAGAKLSQRFARLPWLKALLSALVGLLFIGFALQLALSRLD